MYGKQKTIWEPSNICMFRDLDYIGNGDDDSMRGSGCPLIEGAYELFTSFTVPKFSRDTDIKFTPSLHIEFYDFVKDSQPLIGCVESGTLGQIAREKREAAQGQSLLIMFTVLFVVGFAGCLLGHRRSCKRSERVETNRKNAMIRRFHYRRSVQNGAGLPLRPEMEETELSSFGSGMVREIS